MQQQLSWAQRQQAAMSQQLSTGKLGLHDGEETKSRKKLCPCQGDEDDDDQRAVWKMYPPGHQGAAQPGQSPMPGVSTYPGWHGQMVQTMPPATQTYAPPQWMMHPGYAGYGMQTHGMVPVAAGGAGAPWMY